MLISFLNQIYLFIYLLVDPLPLFFFLETSTLIFLFSLSVMHLLNFIIKVLSRKRSISQLSYFSDFSILLQRLYFKIKANI